MTLTTKKHMLLIGIVVLLSNYSLLGFGIGGPLQSSALTEEQKINHLIQYIEKSKVTFIRNGTEYSAIDAAKHLRMKREDHKKLESGKVGFKPNYLLNPIKAISLAC